MKYLIAALLVSSALFAEVVPAHGPPPGWEGQSAWFMGLRTPIRRISDVVESGISEDTQLRHSVIFPALTVFETVASHDSMAPFYGTPFNLFEAGGDVSGVSGNYPMLVHEINGYPSGAELVLTIPFALVDSTINFEETIQFNAFVRFSVDGNPNFASAGSTIPITYTHNYSGQGHGHRQSVSAVINDEAILDATAIFITILRDDRDSYTGGVAVPYYKLTYPQEIPLVEEAPAPK